MLPKPDIDRIIEELDPPIGFGLYLIKELADEVDFNIETGKGHSLRMIVKKWQLLDPQLSGVPAVFMEEKAQVEDEAEQRNQTWKTG